MWYRNAGRVYHHARPDWSKSGRADCGANIAKPVYVAASLSHAMNGHGGVCKRCTSASSESR